MGMYIGAKTSPLSGICPNLAVDYHANELRNDAVLSGKRCLKHSPGRMPPPDLANLIHRELCPWVVFATRASLSALLHPIVHVVLIRANEQMGRVAAGWVVATVEN